MVNNIVVQLREEAKRPAIKEICTQAADEIERLHIENDRLSESLSNAMRLLAMRKDTDHV